MANGVLSSYFEKQKKSDAPTGGVASPYSAPVDVGGAPTGGNGAGPSAPASAPSAPKGSAGGGTGFVSFGQYFGANAPAVQAQAQKQAAGAKGFEELNVLQKPGGMEGGAFDQMLGGGATQREAKKEGQYRFRQLAERLGEGRPDMTLGGKAITEAQREARYNAYLQQGGSGKTYNQLTEDDKRWVQAAVDGTSFV